VQLVARTHPFRKAGAAVGIGIVYFFFPLFISMFNAGLKKGERMSPPFIFLWLVNTLSFFIILIFLFFYYFFG
jgi:Na+/melibiose symporter-like transporter